MNSLYYLLAIVLTIAHRSFASFPTNFVEEEPAVAVAPEPPTQVFVGPASDASIMSQIPAPAVYHPAAYPHALLPPYYHPRTAVRNVVKGWAKEAGHRSETSVVSEDGHLPATWGIHPAEQLPEALAFPAPFRSRLHRKKMAKKASRTHKTNRNN